MTIRPFAASDVPALVEIETECFSVPWTKGNFEEELQNSAARFFVAEEEGTIVGYVGAWKILDEYDLANVAVRAECRNRGIATALLNRLIDEASREGIDAMTLEVRVGNVPARTLYERFGFEPAGIRPKYYSDGEDALILWKRNQIAER